MLLNNIERFEWSEILGNSGRESSAKLLRKHETAPIATSRATAVQRSGPERAESDRNGQAFGYRETLIASDFSVAGRFGQDRRSTFRIPLGLFQNALFHKAFRHTRSSLGVSF
jgi:hypothetical protein